MINFIIFDWKRTLYNPDTKELIPGALKILEFLKTENIKLVLIGKGSDEMHEEVKRLKVGDYFSKIIFQEGKKDPEQFRPFILENSKDTIFIGDRVRSELAIGNSLGATTIWVKQGKFAEEEPENDQQIPAQTVASLIEALELLKTNFNL